MSFRSIDFCFSIFLGDCADLLSWFFYYFCFRKMFGRIFFRLTNFICLLLLDSCCLLSLGTLYFFITLSHFWMLHQEANYHLTFYSFFWPSPYSVPFPTDLIISFRYSSDLHQHFFSSEPFAIILIILNFSELEV